MGSSITNNRRDSQSIYYRNREKKLRERHEKELNKLQKAHLKEIRELNASVDERVGYASKRAQASLRKQDLRHQREIAKIRETQAPKKTSCQ